MLQNRFVRIFLYVLAALIVLRIIMISAAVVFKIAIVAIPIAAIIYLYLHLKNKDK